MQGRNFSPELSQAIAILAFSASQQAAFDALPFGIEHDEQDVADAAVLISKLTDDHAQHLANVGGMDELSELFENFLGADEGDFADYDTEADNDAFVQFLLGLGSDEAAITASEDRQVA